MGKKGVILDNGKSAQSSMALFWKKHRQMPKQPKKQYEPTEEQQLEQRAESGFQKWKLHKQKMITKAYQKPKSQAEQKINQKQEIEQEEDEVEEVEVQKKIKIPGFKSKELLRSKLKSEQQKNKSVDQSENVLRLPSHLDSLSQQDIIRILREKKSKNNLGTQNRHKENKGQDVMLAQNFMQSFLKNEDKDKDKEQQNQQSVQKAEIVVAKEEPFFKSQILNELAHGNIDIIKKCAQPVQPQLPSLLAPPPAEASPEVKPEDPAKLRPIFKPRILSHPRK